MSGPSHGHLSLVRFLANVRGRCLAAADAVPLEFINQRCCCVMLSQAYFVMAAECRIGCKGAVEAGASEVHILILEARAPMIADRVLHSAADHPADVG